MLARNNFFNFLLAINVANYRGKLFSCKVISRSFRKRMNISPALQWPFLFLVNFHGVLYQLRYDRCGKHSHSGGLFEEE